MFRDGTDVEIADVPTEEGGGDQPMQPSSADMEGGYALVVEEMELVCTIFDIGLGEVLDIHDSWLYSTSQVLTGTSLEGLLDPFCTDPPYNVRSIHNKSNSNYDVFSNTDMEDMVQVVWDVLKKGGYGTIFCSEPQFGIWYKQFTEGHGDDGRVR